MRLKIITILFIFYSFNGFCSDRTNIARAEAMYIFNFSRLIQWPEAQRQGPFVIAVLGGSDVYPELKNYTSGKKVGFQSIKIVKYRSASEIQDCHVLFVSRGNSSELPAAINQLNGKPTLIITEKAGSIDHGAAINFILGGRKLQFELKSSNATSRGLKISARLQGMAAKTY